MKNELKISTLSIVCALCTAVAMPAFGATAVRSLGGAGTYSSASNAASAKTATAGTNTTNAVRGGSMRVGSSTGATRATSSRAATTPRLSIGKYLAGSSAVSGGTNLGGSSSGSTGSGNSGNLQERIVVLEEFMGFSTTGDNIPEQLDAINLRIDELESDISLTTGEHTTVDYEDGVLTVVQNGQTKTFDLAEEYAGKSVVDALQAAVDEIVAGDYAKVSDLESIEKAVAELDAASKELAEDIAGLQSGSVDNATVSQLQQDTAALKSQVEAFAAQLENVATKDEVKDFVTSAEVENAIKDMVTKDEIADLVSSGELQSEIAKLATKDEIANFVTSSDVASAIAGLTTADDVSQAIVNATSALATKQELADAKSELQNAIDSINAGQVELTNYYTKAQTDAMLADYAKQSALEIIQAAIDANKASIDENASDITALETSVADAASEAADANLAAANAASAAVAAQSAADAAKTAADSAQNLANLNASELAGLADVAKTGSYNDLLDQPTLITQDDLTALRSALETQIDAKADAGDVATADALQGVSDALADLKEDSYTKAEIDQKIADAVTGGEIDLSGYATVAALNEAKAALEAKDVELSNGLTALTESLTGYVKSSELAPVAKSGQFSDLQGAPDMTQYVTTTQVENTVETAMNSYEIPDGSITAAKIQSGAVTSDKINTELDAGEMVMLMSNGDGTSSWVAVTVDAE